MKNKATLLFLTILFLGLSGLQAQLSDKEKLTEALYLVDEKRFADAIPLLTEVYEKDKNNANINYNLGVAILNSNDEKLQKNALPYLELASKNVSPNYTPFSPREKKAPVDALFYLGQAQHTDYQFSEAIVSFNEFRKYVNDKHPLWKNIDQNIKMANYAKIAIMNPVNIKTTNLGGKLNGYYADFSPVVRIDESAIYYTSRRLREDSSNFEVYDFNDGKLFEDIYVSFNEDTVWSEPYPLNINTDGHEATVNLSVDGQTLYIYRDENGNGELFKSELEADSAGYETWSEPEKLGSDINSKAYETHVTVTPDNKTLYFVSDREGGFGGKDIYFCRMLPTGNWALSQNVGPILNSEYNEDGVFIHPDGKTMYFSSDGHESMGGYDIVSAILTDSGWTSPKNIGYPINSVDDDVFFVTTPDGKRAYYSSFKNTGYGEKDIYMLELIDAEESALTLYRGEFTFVDRMTPPSGALVSITNNNTGELVGYYTPREKDGQFSAILVPNTSYHFVYEADAYESYEEDIYVPSGNNYSEIYKDIKLKPVRVGDGLDKITPAPMALANLKGGILKIGKPLKGLEIQLLTENEDLINRTTSDSLGDFQFEKLDASKTYLIRVISEDGNPLQNYDVEVENDQGEVLAFEELNDTTYIFVPSRSPYEFYGISAKQIAGKVKKNGNPLSGLNVRLENKDNELIQQEETDEYGEFNFQKLSLDEKYRIVFEGDFPDDPEIIITNELGQQLAFVEVEPGIYEYVPIAEAKGNAIAGVAKKNGAPLSGLNVRLEDESKNMLQKETTDEVGAFNFQQLDLEKAYRIVFEGDFPDGGEIVLLNEYGQELNFVKVSEGVYEYVPKGKPMPKSKFSDIAGTVTAAGVPVQNLKVLLFNQEMNLINSAQTDDLGKFDFMKLNLTKEYTIKFEGDYPKDIKLAIANDDYDLLLFRKIDEGVYFYNPVFVRLEASRENKVLNKEITDNVNEFNFQNLSLDQEYKIVYEGNFPDDDEIIITNKDGDQMVFRKVSEGVYVYVPRDKPMPKSKFSDIAGTVTAAGVPVQNLKVLLFNQEMNLINSAQTDDLGKFDFMKLNLTKEYTIKFEGDYPKDIKLAIANDDYDLLLFRKIDEGVYFYDPVFVRLEASRENKVLDKEITDNVNEFNFQNLSLDQEYKIVYEGNFPDDDEIIITNKDGDQMVFKKVSEGVYVYIPKKGFALNSYTVGVTDENDFKETYPRPEELTNVIAYFQRYFIYNAKDINESNKEFTMFISDIAELVKIRGYADIIITSSASKVPTKTWKTNSILTKKRAYDTKALLSRVFQRKGIKSDQYNFVDINTLITGPEYKGDYATNKSTYEKYQYVRIFVK